MAGERQEAGAGLGIPELEGVVVRAGNDAIAVRAERSGSDLARMAGERLEAGAGLGIPELEGLVTRAGNDALAVRAERRGIDPA